MSVRAMLITKAVVQIVLFQVKILYPSNMPNGMRLKRAIHALKAAPKMAAGKLIGEKAIARNAAERMMLVVGPAMLILPIFRWSAYPPIITAPGAIILKNGEAIDNNVNNAPISVKRNSAHKPFFCAIVLWAISCVKNDAVTMMVNSAKNV